MIRLLMRIKRTLSRIEALLKPKKAKAIEFYVIQNGQKVRMKDMFMKVNQTLEVLLEIVDENEKPAKVDGKPEWALTDATLANLEVAEDGMKAVIKPIGPLGSFKVQVKADADLGEGVEELIGESDVVEIVAGKAKFIKLTLGQPVDA